MSRLIFLVKNIQEGYTLNLCKWEILLLHFNKITPFHDDTFSISFLQQKIMWKEHYFSVDTCIQILSLLGYYNFSCVFWNHQLTSMYSNNLVIHWKLLAWLFWWALLYFSVDMYALYNLSLFRNYPPIFICFRANFLIIFSFSLV